MFGNLKKKLSNAIQEGIVISESLQQHYRQRVSSSNNNNSSSQTSAATTPTTPLGASRLGLNDSFTSSRSSSHSLADGVPTHLNVAAGCNLLSKYEDDWQKIHSTNEENAQQAAAIATQITGIQQRASGQHATITELNNCLAGLPALVVKLQASAKTLQSLEEMGAQLEVELEKLEDLCEECEMQEFVLEQQFQLSKHKQRKLNELEQYRQKIAAEHQQKIRAHELQLRQLQKERQAVFDDAFRSDLEEYKQRGQLTKIPSKISKQTSLDEVVLEQNDEEAKDALEQFLNG
ncbi:dysbindin protein homolog [Drosophila sulfurigaster albostrigata]|uniref:dysbindin protein homolog n=1 Tax=Drosophila sulfurigaster albostrigata TaxID=89887 RepID=UPI002D21C177|nr:dysbindin protein homolog [Drosophila sulfurigaster albostrigata]